MIHELIYTSAPSGLKPGSRGYCTVASSAGMSKPMAEKLESLSGYRHIFPPGTIQADRNPVAYSYVRLQIAGISCFVLSRIADAGLDYSGRSNKLAHHVVLEQKELVDEGPAACLADRRFALKRWTGEARVLPPKSIPPLSPLTPSRENWESATGDPNWCDYLIENVRKSKPVYVVYPVETQVLPLMTDAQSLLPNDERWHMTFSTYYTRIPPGVDCLVRCIPAGTKEAKAVLGRHDQIRIDLSNPTKAPATSILKPSYAESGPDTADISSGTETMVEAVDSGDVKMAPPEIPSTRNKAFHISSSARKTKKKERPVFVSVLLGLIIAGVVFGGLYWSGALRRASDPVYAQHAGSEQDAEGSSVTSPIRIEDDSEIEVGNASTRDPVAVSSSNLTDDQDANSEIPSESASDTPTREPPESPSNPAPKNPVPTRTSSPTNSAAKPIHWLLGVEPKHAITANAIASIQVRPQPESFEVKSPSETGGEWLVNGPDDEGFDSTYLRARVDPSTQNLQISRDHGGEVLATHTVVIELDDSREVFVHPQPTLVVVIEGYSYRESRRFTINDLALPVASSIQCAARVAIDGKTPKDIPLTNNSSASKFSTWIKIDANLAIQLSIDPAKKAGRLMPYVAVGKPPKAAPMSEIMALKDAIRPIIEAVDDTKYILKRVSMILQLHESPDGDNRLSTKQQKQIRTAAEEIVSDLRMIESGTRQFKVKQHLNQSVPGKQAANAILNLSKREDEFPKMPDSFVRPLERFKEFLNTAIKEWKEDKNFQPDAYKTIKDVQQIDSVKLDIVLFKSPEVGGKFPFLRIRTTETAE